jgi:SAM-dependent methyltransferase
MRVAVGRVRGRSVLDVGAGEGRFSRLLAEAGASRVVGVDLAPALVAAARRRARVLPRTVRERLRFLAGDGERLTGLSDASFDIVVSYLSWMHFPDPSRPAREWARLLVPGGVFAAVLPHPFTQAPGARWILEAPPVAEAGPPRRAWFAAGHSFEPDDTRFRFQPGFPALTRNFHRPLSAWSEALGAAGLWIERLWEPRPTAAQARRDPRWQPYREQPYFLVLRARRV